MSRQHKIKVIDLYATKFDPILRFDTEHKRRDLQFDETTHRYREDLIWADHLVFIFPIWWGGMPALLKGYIDRVFSKGFAYKYNGMMPVALLPNKTATIITTHDTPRIYANLAQKDYGKVLQKQVLKMCGIKTKKHLTINYLRHSTLEKREKFLRKVANHANSL